MGLFDSHVHLDDSRFDGDREELISSLSEDGIDYVVNVAFFPCSPSHFWNYI